MSDHWEFYPCQMGEERAFISYDHGLRETIDKLALPNSFRIRAELLSPTAEGMPTQDEFPVLSALEEMLAQRVAEQGGVQLGRITVGGARYFLFLVGFGEEIARDFMKEAQKSSEFPLGYVLEADPKKEAYWSELFPTAEDWQVVQDLKVLDTLQSRGDDPTIPRAIEHWAYFSTFETRESFIAWATGSGFEIVDRPEPDSPPNFGVVISAIGTPTLEEITRTTIGLLHKAQEFHGTYDGWETSVEKKSS